MKKYHEPSKISLGDLRKDPSSYEVWDEEKNAWVEYVDSCYSIVEISAGFPQPSLAAQPVTAITVKQFGKPGFVSFGTKPYKLQAPEDRYDQRQTEMEMLVAFVEWWSREMPDIITGWNVIQFDVPYLVNRIRKVCGEKVLNKLSPFHTRSSRVIEEHKIGDDITYRILGITVYDYLELYKKYTLGSRESYRLDSIAELELGENKLDYSQYDNLMDMYEKDFQLYMDYNIHDVRLIEQLDDKLKFIFLAVTVAYLGKVKLHEIFGQVKFWDNLIYTELMKKNIQLYPPTRQHKDEAIQGAYVKDPRPGSYNWVVSLDLASLYPSIIMMGNLSPETLVEAANDKYSIEQLIEYSVDLSELKTKNLAMVANCSTYTKDKLGVLPEITKKMFSSRKAYKSKMLAAKKEKERLIAAGGDQAAIDYQAGLVVVFDAMQNAFKVALNSLYGASANENFRYYNPSISEGITLTGQVIIRFIGNQINEFLNRKLKTNYDYVIASDTDSAYLDLEQLVKAVCPPDMPKTKIVDFLDKFVEKHLTPYINERFAFLADYLNSYENTLNMKREAIADRAIWRAKKNYIIQVYDNEGVRYAEPELKMMGVETARSSTPKFVKTALAKCYEILINGTEADLIAEVSAFKKRFMQAPIADIAFPRGVSDMDKWMDRIHDWKTGTPIHVKCAILYNKLLKQHKLDKSMPKIKNGDKIKFIYLKEPNETRNNAIAFFDELPKQFNLDMFVDRKLQYEKTFLGPLESLSILAKMETEKRITFDGFFSTDDAVTEVTNAKFDLPKEVVKAARPPKETKPSNRDVTEQKKPAAKAKKVDMTAFFS